MNKEWSEINRRMQTQLKKQATYPDALQTLFTLRAQLMEKIFAFRQLLSPEEYSAMPFPNANGLHHSTVAYSLWHIFRIEDIVAHTLIQDDAQVLFAGNYQERIGSPIITTGNELCGAQIAAFSESLHIDALYDYISAVKCSTEEILRMLPYEMLRQKIPDTRKEKLLALNVVSTAEASAWLVDYWCGKEIRGLIQMPFSRHWIMHTEACLRIVSKLKGASVL